MSKDEAGTVTTLPARRKPAELTAVDFQKLMMKSLERDTADTLKELVALQQRIALERARCAWHAAVDAFQSECPEIPRTKKGRFGNYADLGVTLQIARPFLAKHGLSVTWTTRRDLDGAPLKVCRLAHSLGHVEEAPCPIIVDENAGKDRDGKDTLNAMQKHGIADKYAKRYSFEAVTGIVPKDADTDGDAKSSTVKQPRATRPPHGERTEEPPHTVDAETSTNGQERSLSVVQVESVTKRVGKKGNTPWTKFKAICAEAGDDQVEYGTFSETFGVLLQGAAGQDEWLELEWVDSRYGREIREINPAEAPE